MSEDATQRPASACSHESLGRFEVDVCHDCGADVPSVDDLPGMWSTSDFTGGNDD